MLEHRHHNLLRLRENPAVDVIVVGGGVNGIGVYRDLALQGLRVLLVERNDFSSGCSAAPSRMIHGGLRYLENGEFDLVRESLEERDRLLRNAPHMVRPLPTVIPIQSLFSGLFNSAATFLGWSGKPAARGVVPVMMGLGLYDWLTRHRRIVPKHAIYGRKATFRRWPNLTSKARYSATFHDAWISHPERLCIELLKDTAREAPESIALNYAELRRDADTYTLCDRISGDTLTVKPRVIVNATGAWLDESVELLAETRPERMVSGTKGSHLILDNADLYDALDGHMVYFENADGRVCIVFPYLGKVLAGSTDIRVERAKRTRCEPDELDYILESLRMAFEGIDVSADDVVFSYSGIRPLPVSDTDFTGRISRGHDVRRLDGTVPQFCMIGGKWTTFRAFAEQTADGVLTELGTSRTRTTRDVAIGGGVDFSETVASEIAQEFSLSVQRAEHLVNHYGTQARDVARFCAESPDTYLTDAAGYSENEFVWLVQNEFVQSVSDVLLRRTSIAIRGQITGALLARVADIVGDTLSLSSEIISAQRAALVEELVTYHGAMPERLALEEPTEERSMTCA